MVQGWTNLFQARSHNVLVWNNQKPFDTFNQFRPDVFITTGGINNELYAALSEHNPRIYPNCASYAADNLRYFPVKGRQFPICYVGGYNQKKYWIDENLIPLCIAGEKVQIFGYGDWPVPNYLGFCSDQTEREIYSTGIIINKTDYYNEKPFKVFACKGICLTSYTPEMEQLFGKELLFRNKYELKAKIELYKNPKIYKNTAEKYYNLVTEKHTYYHRWCQEEWL